MNASLVHPKSLRGDIQALRAIAVLLVIFDHLGLIQRLPGDPLGGFVGVDMFFVISGFLITQQLVSEVGRTGRISFADFYRRRARRILPMALLVIAVTILAATSAFWPWRAMAAAADGLWSALFVSNIVFALRGVDYFAADQVSVFQHYWSLSVEEQFYLVWPVVILLVGSTAVSQWRRRLLYVILVLGSVSLVWACISTLTSPASAYFSTFARAYQFSLGAMLAVGAPRLVEIPDAVRRLLSWAGLCTIGICIWVIDPAKGFPGPMGLFPACGAAMFIAAGTEAGRDFAPGLLRLRPITYIGDISFSLYLWHWPIIVFVDALIPRDVVVIPCALVLTFFLSAISYRYVERSVLKSGWLAPREEKSGQRPDLRIFWRNAGFMSAAIAGSAGAVAGGDFAVRKLSAAKADFGTSVSLQVQDQPDSGREIVESIQALIAESRGRKNWENLKPDISTLSSYGTELTRDCWTGHRGTPRTCLRGNPDAPHTIAVFGDSISMNAAFSVDDFVRRNPDWKMVVYAKLGCSFATIEQRGPDGSEYVECGEFRKWAVSQINEMHPDVVWTSSVPTRSKVKGDELVRAWQRGLETTLGSLSTVPRIMVVAPPPPGHDLAFCSRPFNVPDDCAGGVSEQWLALRDASLAAATSKGRTFVDTAMWYCDEDGYCPAVIGDYIVRRDERHITYDYGVFISPLVDAWVLQDHPGSHMSLNEEMR